MLKILESGNDRKYRAKQCLALSVLFVQALFLLACSSVGWHESIAHTIMNEDSTEIPASTSANNVLTSALGSSLASQSATDAKEGPSVVNMQEDLSRHSMDRTDYTAISGNFALPYRASIRKLEPAGNSDNEDNLLLKPSVRPSLRPSTTILPSSPALPATRLYSVERGWFTRPVNPAKDIQIKRDHSNKIRGEAVPFRLELQRP